MSDRNNGAQTFKCLFDSSEWFKHREDIKEAHVKIHNCTEMLNSIQASTDSWKRIACAMEEMKEGVMNKALGKDEVPIDVVREMMTQQQKAYLSIIKMMSVIFGLIILVLIGLKYLSPHLFT